MKTSVHKLALMLLNASLFGACSVMTVFLSVSPHMGDRVDNIMQAYSEERFRVIDKSIFDSPYLPGFLKGRRPFTPESGVMVTMPSGNQVRTGFLEKQARPILD